MFASFAALPTTHRAAQQMHCQPKITKTYADLTSAHFYSLPGHWRSRSLKQTSTCRQQSLHHPSASVAIKPSRWSNNCAPKLQSSQPLAKQSTLVLLPSSTFYCIYAIQIFDSLCEFLLGTNSSYSTSAMWPTWNSRFDVINGNYLSYQRNKSTVVMDQCQPEASKCKHIHHYHVLHGSPESPSTGKYPKNVSNRTKRLSRATITGNPCSIFATCKTWLPSYTMFQNHYQRWRMRTRDL
jgi:hypothetical protein